MPKNTREDTLPFAAFMSYAHDDDTHDNGQLTQFRLRLMGEVKAVTGRDFWIFQDRVDIAQGQNWRQRIDSALSDVTFLLTLISPNFMSSTACLGEVERFVEHERTLGRNDLILPIYYISARELENEPCHQPEGVAALLAERQYTDWRELRFAEFTAPEARRAMNHLALRIKDAFAAVPGSADRPPPRSLLRLPGKAWLIPPYSVSGQRAARD